MSSLLVSAVLASTVLAGSVVQSRSQHGSLGGTIQMGLMKNRMVEGQQLSRRGPTDVTMYNGGNLYNVNVTLGTPPQSFAIQLDTGSSDLWVPTTDNPNCVASQCVNGAYNMNASSTPSMIAKGNFSIRYLDGSSATGDYITETLTVGGATIPQFQIGISDNSSVQTGLQPALAHGLMGVGYPSNEAVVRQGAVQAHPSVAEAFVSAGVISSNAYSLWLNDQTAASGDLLFGGIDTAKYSGDLTSLTILPSSPGVYHDFSVAFTSLSVSSSSGTDTLTKSNFPYATVLDSGSSITMLPDDIMQDIIAEVGATSVLDTFLVVPCGLANQAGNITFGFGGPAGAKVAVPISSLVTPVPDAAVALLGGQVPTYPDGQKVCLLGLQSVPFGGTQIIFGDTFLRNAYVTYDLANNVIGIAQAKVKVTDSNIVPFASAGAPIPSAKTIANEVTAVNAVTAFAPQITAPQTALPPNFSLTFPPVPKTLSAASGFAPKANPTGATTGPAPAGPAPTGPSATPSATTKPNAASSIKFDMSVVFVSLGSMGCMLIGGGLLAWL